MRRLRGSLSAVELEELGDLLELAGLMSLEELTGFFAALATTPEMVPPSSWLPEVLPFDGFESVDEAEVALELIMRHYNDVNRALSKGRLTIPAPRDDRQAFCSGYLRAARRDDVFLVEEDDGTGQVDPPMMCLYSFLVATGEAKVPSEIVVEGEALDFEGQVNEALEMVPTMVRTLYQTLARHPSARAASSERRTQ